jgi:hypothetical protein
MLFSEFDTAARPEIKYRHGEEGIYRPEWEFTVPHKKDIPSIYPQSIVIISSFRRRYYRANSASRLPPDLGGDSSPLPIQVARQAQEFIQAAIFHVSLLDVAAGQRVRQPGAIQELETNYISHGLAPQTWEDSWRLVSRYQESLEAAVFQSVVVALRSHWDWYVRRIGEFVFYCRSNVPSVQLTKAESVALSKIGWKEFIKQLAILEVATGLALTLPTQTTDSIILMTHVRNLGLHNRWEVDGQYLESHPSCELAVGDIRPVPQLDLETWSTALRVGIQVTSVAIAKKYVAAPDYPPMAP